MTHPGNDETFSLAQAKGLSLEIKESPPFQCKGLTFVEYLLAWPHEPPARLRRFDLVWVKDGMLHQTMAGGEMYPIAKIRVHSPDNEVEMEEARSKVRAAVIKWYTEQGEMD